jgi:predicted peroxiredoxin
MRTLYMATGGTSDPTRASIPLHLAVNGSLELGHSVGIVLAGDAAELGRLTCGRVLKASVCPPIRDLFAKARQHDPSPES